MNDDDNITNVSIVNWHIVKNYKNEAGIYQLLIDAQVSSTCTSDVGTHETLVVITN